ncbi:unnamed protein product [Darwinula stevensoni]|uniref:Uncharacterized protein n=1 Tax=Darwinula stevensoni TaxID=69355 RepID=A0A7R9AGD1_9CRUS|nr:unnamed protein product [Darwinula stevensoni]CAG0904178.1 unnamed protein product [Darwinula stevensoni]
MNAVAVMLGILYLRQDLTAEGVMNINGALFLFLLISSYQNSLAVIYVSLGCFQGISPPPTPFPAPLTRCPYLQVFCEDQPIFLREQRSGLYRADAYYLGKTLAELPFYVIFPAAFTAIAYPMIGLDPGRFLVCVLVMVAIANVSCSFGTERKCFRMRTCRFECSYMASCIASTVEMVLAFVPTIMMPIMMLSGFFLNNDTIPWYLIWVKYISWFYYGNEALVINQWKGVEKIECGDSFACPENGDSRSDSRKRLSIASEVLTDPPLLFCDEPTSGLDSFMAQQVVALMKSLAEKGKTVISTIHQPSSEVYSLFDRILLMAEGRTAFMGKVDFVISFFQGVGYECPPNYNPGDFFIKTLAVVPGEEEECRRRVVRICDAFRDSEEGRAMEKEVELQRVDGAWNDPGEFKRNVKSKGSWFAQFRTILARSWTANLREPLLIKLRILQTVAVAVMLGILYLRQDLTAEGVMNINGALFLFLLISSYQNSLAVIYVFCEDQPIFLREQRSGLYRADAYYLGKTLAELPFFVVFPAAFTAIAYPMIGLDPGRFLVCVLVMVAIANVSCSFGYMASCIASTVEMVLALAPTIMMPIMLLSGFFLNNDTIPSYLIWVKYISWFYYGNEALVINQWKGVEKIECGDSFACPENGDEVIASLNFDKDNEVRDWLMLLVLMMAFRIIGVLALHFRAARQK